MLTTYIEAAMRHAQYEELPQEGLFYGEIPGFEGLYMDADTLEACREGLREALEEWVLLRVSRHLALPEVDGIELAIKSGA